MKQPRQSLTEVSIKQRNALLINTRPAAITNLSHSKCTQNNDVTTLKDVKDLKLTADFRAVKLRWSYDYSEAANEPASFDIR